MPMTESQRQYQREYYKKNRDKRNAAAKARGALHRAEKKVYDKERRLLKGDEIREYDRSRAKIYIRRVQDMVGRARSRAKKYGLPFALTSKDIEIPEFCPVLGVKMEWHDKQGGSPLSPSIDRIQPSLGYVRGNVAVISSRANRIKTDATAEEVQKVADWLKRAAVLEK